MRLRQVSGTGVRVAHVRGTVVGLVAWMAGRARNRTRKWQHPNVQSKRIWVEELNRFVRLSLSTRAIRTITKVGLVAYARKKGLDLAALAD